MPKYVEPLKLNEIDAIKLAGIASGDIPAGEDVKKRAGVVLELSKGTMIKDAAGKFGMRENTVTEIRRRFLKNGMASLAIAPKSGRPVKGLSAADLEKQLDAFMASFKRDNSRLPTVMEVSQGLNASLPVVREAMKARNLIPERQRSWEIALPGNTEPRVIDLAGMYLSGVQQILAVKVTDVQVKRSSKTGNVMITGSRSFADSCKNTDMSVHHYEQLAALLEAFIAANPKNRKRSMTGTEFIRAVTEANGAGEKPAYHLLVHGSQVAEKKGTMLTSAVLVTCADSSAWLLKTKCLLDLLRAESGSARHSARIISALEGYLSSADEDAEPFIWMKKSSREPELKAEPASDAESQSFAPGTVMAEVKIMGDDGQWISCKAMQETGLRQKDLNPHSLDSYLKAVAIIEQSIANTSRAAARIANEKYLNETVNINSKT
ncbi:transposase [Succinimonas sp.]|uniref:helix-turn-helix domain-containing protein n=1 Tax=Succinimonas sp. TaxID=1936151 RepID=UPI0038630C6A